MGNNSPGSKTLQVEIHVSDVPVRILFDTGALIDIIDKTTFTKINHNRTVSLDLSNKRLFVYGSDSQLDVWVSLVLTKISMGNRFSLPFMW